MRTQISLLSILIIVFLSNSLVHGQTVPGWDVKSDTWVATDALGRTLPGHTQTGDVKDGKTVAMFYFLWNGRHGEQGPFDVTKILQQDPDAMTKKDSPLWGPMYVPHHWGESIFGYYVGEDRYVLRKHAQMLGDAGVDVIVFDVTNQLTYPESYKPLCEVFQEVRAAGNHAPQIAFLTPFWAPRKVVLELWKDLYEPKFAEETWFRWKGKPLILADPELLLDAVASDRSKQTHPEPLTKLLEQKLTIEKPFLQISVAAPTWSTKDSGFTLTLRKDGPKGAIIKSQKIDNHPDNQWATLVFEKPQEAGTYFLCMDKPVGKVGWWTGEPPQKHVKNVQGFINDTTTDQKFAFRVAFGDEETAKILNFFTFRKPQPDYFVGPTGPNQWGWLEVYPQHGFYTEDGGVKRIEQVAVGTAQNAVAGKLGVLSNPKAHGRSFHDGSEPAPGDCDFLGRNFEEQWKRAYELNPEAVFVTGWNEWIMGRFDETAPFHGSGVVSFVDQFNHEFSRDIEPVVGGHEDAYYYQMIDHLRRFKGAKALEKVKSQPIRIDGQFEDWKDVQPEFRDTIGDTVHRNERGWGKDTRYENTTGRNDIMVCKASRDEANVYFYVRISDDSPGFEKDAKGTLLFIDADCSTQTGWLGYDFVFNRDTGTLQKNVGGRYEWADGVKVPFHVTKTQIELAVPRSVLGENCGVIHFKWTDNISQTGQWSDFTLNGDSAPNDRYNYRAEFE